MKRRRSKTLHNASKLNAESGSVSFHRNDRAIGIQEMDSLVNLRVTHKRASIPILDALNFRDVKEASKEIKAIEGVEECLVLQTCNRVELYLSVSKEGSSSSSPEKKVAKYWCRKNGFDEAEFYRYLEVSYSSDVILHLMRLASGLESMVVGEDQILGQIQDAFSQAREYRTVGHMLSKVFGRAVKIGRVVRVKTNINRGAVSLGSIAVNLLEDVAGDLEGKKVLIIGAGRIGALAGKALAARRLAFIFLANRNYKRAVSLSKMLNAKAVKFDRLVESLAMVDIVIVATAAPHYILTRSKVEESLKRRVEGRKLLIIDLSQPRNVEKDVAGLPDVELHNIDNLRDIADSNLKLRLQEVEKAEHIIQNEMSRITVTQKQLDVEPIIQAVSRRADAVRRRELEKAYRLMKVNPKVERCEHCMKVMDNLSKTIMEKTMLYPLLKLRSGELEKDAEKITILQEVLSLRHQTEPID